MSIDGTIKGPPTVLPGDKLRCSIFGHPNFKGGTQYVYSDFNHKHTYKLIKIRDDILIQCHWNNMEMKKFNYYA